MAGVEGVGGKGPSEETKRRLKAQGGGAAFQAAAKESPEDEWVLSALGAAYRSLGDSKNAANTLSRAVELDPEDDWAWEELAAAYRDMKRPAKARAAQKRARELRRKGK